VAEPRLRELQTLWFGSNETGLDNSSTLALVGRHSLSIYNWLQGYKTHGPTPRDGRHGEVAQAEAILHSRDYLNAAGNHETVLAGYRQIQLALGCFDIGHKAAQDPALRDLWLHADGAYAEHICTKGAVGQKAKWYSNASDVCGMDSTSKPAQWGTLDPYWNFSNPRTVDYWLNHTIEEVCTEHSGATTFYFDEVDSNWCGWWDGNHGNCSFALETQRAQMRSTYLMLTKMVTKLNDCGIVPVLATFGNFRASRAGLHGQDPCVLDEDELALEGLVWARFYEQWPDEFHMHHAGTTEPDRFAQIIANGVIEAQRGIPVVAHTGNYGLSPCEGDKKKFALSGTHDLFDLAAFYIAMSPTWVFGVSTGWIDSAYCWRQAYDIKCGEPLNNATRTGAYTFTRNFTGCDVFVDTNSSRPNATQRLYGEIRLK